MPHTRLIRRITGIIMGAFLAILTLVGVFTFSYIATFSKVSNVPVSTIWHTGIIGWKNSSTFDGRTVTFLILGLDKRDDAFEKTLLTDTMMIARLNPSDRTLNLLPLPRDIWIHDYKTKINALYFYGGTPLTTSVVESITGLTIDYYVILNYQKLPAFVDSLEGITVTVEKGFTDNHYPNPYYTEDGKNGPPYVTIMFEEGTQILNGEQTLEYVRSRGSDDTTEGSDEARSRRQLHVVNGLFDRLKDKNILINPGATGAVYRLWKEHVETNISDSDIVSFARIIGTHPVPIQSVHIPTSSDNISTPVLVHPPITKYGLWVWEPADGSWENLHEFIEQTMQ